MASLSGMNVNQLSISILYDTKPKSSFCWRYFGDIFIQEDTKRIKIRNDQVFCSVCLSIAQETCEANFKLGSIKSYSKSVSTGNLVRHLRDVHNIREEGFKRKKTKKHLFAGQPKAKTAATTSGLSTKKIDTWTLAHDMVLWFCKSLMPFDSVSDEAMQDFFRKYGVITSEEDIPSRDTVSRTVLDQVYESIMEKVNVQIQTDAPGHAAMTFDLWSDPYRHLNYITFTLHYLTSDFELKSLTLFTKMIEGEKTGAKIEEILNETKESFDLQGVVLHSVTDAGLNVKRAIPTAAIDNHLCLGHGLHNLVTVDGIGSVPEIDSLIKKCKTIIKTITYRSPNLEQSAETEQIEFLGALECISEHLEMDENDPIVDYEEPENSEDMKFEPDTDPISQTISIEFANKNYVPRTKTSSPTRWHTVLALLECLGHFRNRNPINNILSQIGQEHLKIYQHEWNLLEDVTKFLRKFSEVVEMLSSQKTASLNLALVFHLEIRDILNSVTDEETLIILTLKNKMLTKLDKRFPITDKLIVASLLDLRFVGLSLVDTYLSEKRLTRAEFLAEYIRKMNITGESVSTAPVARSFKSPNESLLTKLVRKHSSGMSNSELNRVEQECWKYLSAGSPSDVEGDVLRYWQERKKQFPLLSELAKAILAIPATSIPSERIFSMKGLTITAKRSRLNPVRVNKITFIHDNSLLVQENCFK